MTKKLSTKTDSDMISVPAFVPKAEARVYRNFTPLMCVWADASAEASAGAA